METINNSLFVGLGGFLGAVSRYLVALILPFDGNGAFPLGTFLVNIAGCFILGLLSSLAEAGFEMKSQWNLLLSTGFCGAFTTFSTFMLETHKLGVNNKAIQYMLYILLSIVIGYALLFAGIWLGRAMLGK